MTTAPIGLHRHQLAWLSRAAWDDLRQRDWDRVAAECLGHWARCRLPLVVTRQSADSDMQETIAMGLPAPGRWERRRIALHVSRGHIIQFGEFPRMEQVQKLLAESMRDGWARLCADLKSCGAIGRVYGSYGWQYLSGLDHVRRGSDLDLQIAVSSAWQADNVAHLLDAFIPAAPRLDGELVFERDQAVAWREWLSWRSGRTRAVLVKSIDGNRLCNEPCHDLLREEATT
jgi:phosphoribosyl-dephospho-CoA transferase